jgi:hypothetical protein
MSLLDRILKGGFFLGVWEGNWVYGVGVSYCYWSLFFIEVLRRFWAGRKGKSWTCVRPSLLFSFHSHFLHFFPFSFCDCTLFFILPVCIGLLYSYLHIEHTPAFLLFIHIGVFYFAPASAFCAHRLLGGHGIMDSRVRDVQIGRKGAGGGSVGMRWLHVASIRGHEPKASGVCF